jgi:hypothetical protein
MADTNTMRVYIESVKDIPAGGEILVQYGKEYWDVITRNIKIDEREKNAAKKKVKKKTIKKKAAKKKK